jgi:hypothetical protein
MARSTARLVISGLLGAAVLALAGCGTDRGSSVALGDDARAPAATTPSHNGVVFVPLDSPMPGGSSAPGAGTPRAGGTPSPAGPSRAPATTPGGSTSSGSTHSGSGGSGGSGSGAGNGGGAGGTPSSPPPQGGQGGSSGGGNGGGGGSTGGGATGGTGTPPTPASLTVTSLETAETSSRWCQRVTLTLVNSGDRTATSGAVTFATHVIGALGIDWWTYRTSQPLASPVAGHATANESWTVCLDAWRVPLGMHLETRAATVG